MLAVGLALLAAVSWGAADYLAGVLSRRIQALVVLVGQQFAGLVLAGAVLLAVGEGPPDTRGVLLSLGAGLAAALALSTFYRALAVGTMSVVAPITSTSIVIPFAAGIAMGERPAGLQLVGLLLAGVGVVLAAREERDDAAPVPGGRKAVGLALLAALGFGLFATLADASAEASVLWFLVLARASAITVLAVAGTATGGLRPPGRRDAGTIAVIGLLDVSATALYGIALNEGLLSVVSVVGSLFPVVTAVMAWLLLRERLSRLQLAGVGVAFAGVGLIAGGG